MSSSLQSLLGVRGLPLTGIRAFSKDWRGSTREIQSSLSYFKYCHQTFFQETPNSMMITCNRSIIMWNALCRVASGTKWHDVRLIKESAQFLRLYQANLTVSIGWNQWNIGPNVQWKTVENLVLMLSSVTFHQIMH